MNKIAAESRLPRGLERISVGISLMILSLGFFFLGLLPFFDQPPADLSKVAAVDGVSWIAASSASLLTGTTFLGASWVYWRRYSDRPAANAQSPSPDLSSTSSRQPKPVAGAR